MPGHLAMYLLSTQCRPSICYWEIILAVALHPYNAIIILRSKVCVSSIHIAFVPLFDQTFPIARNKLPCSQGRRAWGIWSGKPMWRTTSFRHMPWKIEKKQWKGLNTIVGKDMILKLQFLKLVGFDNASFHPLWNSLFVIDSPHNAITKWFYWHSSIVIWLNRKHSLSIMWHFSVNKSKISPIMRTFPATVFM